MSLQVATYISKHPPFFSSLSPSSNSYFSSIYRNTVRLCRVSTHHKMPLFLRQWLCKRQQRVFPPLIECLVRARLCVKAMPSLAYALGQLYVADMSEVAAVLC